jgi:hypothetical protein
MVEHAGRTLHCFVAAQNHIPVYSKSSLASIAAEEFIA